MVIKMKLLSTVLYLTAVLILSSSLVLAERTTEEAGIQKVKDYFGSQGFVLLKNFFRDERQHKLLRELKKSSNILFHDIFEALYLKGYTKFPEHSRTWVDESSQQTKRQFAIAEGRQNGFHEIVMRNPGRYEIRWDPEIVGGASIQPLVDQLKGIIPSLFNKEFADMSQLNLHISLIMATTDSTEQTFHADGEHLDLAQHQPVHCLNVFVPLVDVPDNRGPTEFYPASHFTTRQPSPMKLDTAQLKPPYAPELKVGDALIFDYRTLHRGKPNLSRTNRPMLVFSFSEEWFTDVKNWPERSMMKQRVVES